MNKEKEYQPGITELRINVKGFHAMADKISKDMMDMYKRITAIEQHNASLTQENIDIKKLLQELQAKLYENGIR